MDVDVNMDAWQLRRRGALILSVVLLLVAAFFAREHVVRLLSGWGDGPSVAEVKAVVRSYLDGELSPDDPRIPERMVADLERLAQLPHGEFIAFEEEPHIIAATPEDAPTWVRLVGSARYRSPTGKVFLGEISVEMVKGADEWKVDRILVRPLVNVEP